MCTRTTKNNRKTPTSLKTQFARKFPSIGTHACTVQCRARMRFSSLAGQGRVEIGQMQVARVATYMYCTGASHKLSAPFATPQILGVVGFQSSHRSGF